MNRTRAGAGNCHTTTGAALSSIYRASTPVNRDRLIHISEVDPGQQEARSWGPSLTCGFVGGGGSVMVQDMCKA
jgi:hypothetical protein